MSKFINGRWVYDAELYPEQFEDLPEEAERRSRKRAVKLSDIGSDGDTEGFVGAEKRGKSLRNSDKLSRKSSGLDALLSGTAPSWKRDGVKNGSKNAVNPRENEGEECGSAKETVSQMYGKRRRETAKAYAMKIVAMGAVTERRLREKLIAREYSEEETEEALIYVKSFGYVNDMRLAQDMIEKLAARHWGRFKICYYLKGKGISEEVIEGLDFSEIDFPYYCAQFMKKYPAEKRGAMLRAVKNAGYNSDDIRKARRIIEEEEE